MSFNWVPDQNYQAQDRLYRASQPQPANFELKTSEFADHFSGLAQTEGLVAAGPITKQPGTLPYRVILVDLGNKFVVFDEIFEEASGEKLSPNTETATRFGGEYFAPNQLDAATKRFAQRVAEYSTTIQSIYR